MDFVSILGILPVVTFGSKRPETSHAIGKRKLRKSFRNALQFANDVGKDV